MSLGIYSQVVKQRSEDLLVMYNYQDSKLMVDFNSAKIFALAFRLLPLTTSKNMYKFAAASEREEIVFGAAKPGYSDEQIQQWLEFMQSQNIQRVCCLLAPIQLNKYSDLLGIYLDKFGSERVCWAPIEDFQLVDIETLNQKILPFLLLANQQNEKVVVHCAGGVGRTGHVLAAWLVKGRGFSNQAAILAVRKTGRNPYEAAIVAFLKGRNPWKVVAELNALLDDCRQNSQ